MIRILIKSLICFVTIAYIYVFFYILIWKSLFLKFESIQKISDVNLTEEPITYWTLPSELELNFFFIDTFIISYANYLRPDQISFQNEKEIIVQNWLFLPGICGISVTCGRYMFRINTCFALSPLAHLQMRMFLFAERAVRKSRWCLAYYKSISSLYRSGVVQVMKQDSKKCSTLKWHYPTLFRYCWLSCSYWPYPSSFPFQW